MIRPERAHLISEGGSWTPPWVDFGANDLRSTAHLGNFPAPQGMLHDIAWPSASQRPYLQGANHAVATPREAHMKDGCLFWWKRPFYVPGLPRILFLRISLPTICETAHEILSMGGPGTENLEPDFVEGLLRTQSCKRARRV